MPTPADFFVFAPWSLTEALASLAALVTALVVVAYAGLVLFRAFATAMAGAAIVVAALGHGLTLIAF